MADWVNTNNRKGGPQGTHVVALAADMIFASKIQGAARLAGREVTMARNAESLLRLATETVPSLIIIDLDTRGLDIENTVRAARDAAPDAQVLAYVSHVRTDAISEARGAGADRVLARSGFVAQLPSLLNVGGAGSAHDEAAE
jgi:DNA-binding NarL/FixJ family response regulator